MNKFWVCLSSLLITSSGVSTVFAQTTDVDYELEEVVVTAELREVNLQKVSTSIQVTSGEELRKEGKRRIDEIMQGTVGIQMQDSQNGVTFFVRGIDGGGSGAGDVVSTPVIVDGVAMSRAESVRGGTLDLARAEVMRGPQSTTLGANALSGAVSLVSNKPVFNYEASANLEMGNYHLSTMDGVMNVPFADNQAVRIAFTNTKRDGYYSNGAGASDLRTARIKHRWQPTSDIDITTTIQHQNIGGNGVSQLTLLAYGQYKPFISGGAFTPGSTTNKFSVCQSSAGLYTSQYASTDPRFNLNDASQFGNCVYTNAITASGATTPIANYQTNKVSTSNSALFLGAVPYLPGIPLKDNNLTVLNESLLNLSCLPGDDPINCYGKLQNTLGGVPEFSGVPTSFYPMFDGTNFHTRANPWDDGTAPSVWSNSPYANTNTELASVEVNWTTSLGAVTFLPSYQTTHFNQQQPYRTYQAIGADNYQRTKIADLRINSNSGEKLQWQAGLYYKDDRQSLNQLTMNAPGVAGMTGMTTGSTTGATDPGTCNYNSAGATINATSTLSWSVSPGKDPVLVTPLVNNSPCYSWTVTPRLDRISKSAYFNGEYSMLDTLRLIGGLRFADETASQLALNAVNGDRYAPYPTCDSGLVDPVTGASIPKPECKGSTNATTNGLPPALDNVTANNPTNTRWTHTTFRGGLEWDVLPETMVYGVYSTGFNPGSVGGMTFSVLPAVTLEQLTFGLKSQGFDNRVQFNTEAFLTTYHNRPVDGTVIVYSNDLDAGQPGEVDDLSNSTTCSVGMGATQISAALIGSGYCMALGSPFMKDFNSMGIDMDATFLLSPVDRLYATAEFMSAKYEKAPQFYPTTAQGDLTPTLDASGNPTVPSICDLAKTGVDTQFLTNPQNLAAGYDPVLDTFQRIPNTKLVTAPRVYLPNGQISATYVAFVAACGGGTSVANKLADAKPLAALFDLQANGFVGTTLQNSPKFSATLTYSHTFNLAGGSQVIPKIAGVYKTQYWSMGGGGPGNVGLNVVHAAANDPSSKYYFAWQQNYTTWDASTQWNNADGKFTINAYVKNLTNEPVMTSYTYSSVSLQPPRTWGATFTANF